MYRQEVDGLRALAVLSVVLYHAGLPGLSGGYLGVDVFFVISGFLITSLLLADLANGQFSVMHFYERRARRLLPALTVMLLVCVPFAWALQMPSVFADFGESVTATAIFASNVHFWEGLDYFNIGAREHPLLHTWSLAIEEQYYLLFPLLLWALFRFTNQTVIYGALVLGILLSLWLCQWGWQNKPDVNY